MKHKILSSILTTIVVFTAKAQIVNIPDAVFKAVLVANASINTNNDTEIQVSEAQNYTGAILCGGQGISDLTGIEYFPNITELFCPTNNITDVDLSQNTALIYLSLSDNHQLTSLDVSQNTTLESLSCTACQLSSLDVTMLSNLRELEIDENQLTNLNISQNTALEYLFCGYNQLSNLDVSHNPNLIHLDCPYTLLSSIDISLNPSLSVLFSHGNTLLTDLNLANGNNADLTVIRVENCPNLHCVKVDDAVWSVNNWPINVAVFWSVTNTAIYFYDDNTDCLYTDLGTNDPTENEKSISVFPNPTKDKINFSVQTNMQLTNVTGQVVAKKTNVNSLDISGQPAGIYFITLTDDKGQIIQRSNIVKE